MVMPMAGRVVAAVIGGLLVIVAAQSVTGTLIVSRPVSSRMTRWVDRLVDAAYQVLTSRSADYKRRDQLLATQAAAILVTQLVVWLGVSFAGYALLLWPFARRGLASAQIGDVGIGAGKDLRHYEIELGLVVDGRQIAVMPLKGDMVGAGAGLFPGQVRRGDIFVGMAVWGLHHLTALQGDKRVRSGVRRRGEQQPPGNGFCP